VYSNPQVSILPTIQAVVPTIHRVETELFGSDIWTSLNADHQMIGWQGCELILMPAIFISFVCLFCCPKTLLLDAAVVQVSKPV